MTFEPPSSGEEVVISGISGRFPESKNVLELQHNLLNKVDMVTSNATRWNLDHPEIPKDGGKIHGLMKFDGRFFGVHIKQAHAMDPMCRLLLEHSYEAILDAGIHPRELHGSNTGVVVGISVSEAEKTWLYENTEKNGFGIIGCSRSMLANRISYTLGLHGPSYTVDAACSSSSYALDQAYRLIRSGQCDNVLVGGAHLCLHPRLSAQFTRLGVLSPDCRCKSFDARANGYVRSEAVSIVFLQKAKYAKRIYATVVYTKTNCDGYKEQGITFPSSEVQKNLLEEFYGECQIPPTTLSWLETHGSGTAVGDPEELKAISRVLCKGRDTPLRIGSIKSNIGHTEAASGLCSVTKVIIGMETGLIPPNLHFQKPSKGMKCLEHGQAQVVTEPTPWECGYVGINSFGFGGTNVHILLKSNPKKKVNKGAPTDNLPRIVAVSGCTREAVDTLLKQVENLAVIDVEYVRLLHEIYAQNIPKHIFRGYTIVSKPSKSYIREINEYPGINRPVWFVFSGMGSQWAGMGEALMKFPVFAKAIQKCDTVLKPRGMNIVDIITNKNEKTYHNILNAFVGITAVQIGLVDLLTSVGIVPDNMIGHSVGELGCAYADGCFTAEQMILSAYSRGMACTETEMVQGAMAAVGLGYEDIRNQCPNDIEVACHNSSNSCTISGPTESIKQFIVKLQANNVFASEVSSSNIAFHSRYIAAAAPKLMAYLSKVIPDPKPRSQKWVSTSVPRSDWSSPRAQYSSAEYHTNNLLSPVLFAETATIIPENAITIEIAPHGLLQAILRRSLGSNVTNVALTQRGHQDNTQFFLQALGKLYNLGLQPQFSNLYPSVEFPVSSGTPMISPYIKWDHSDDWFVPNYSQPEEAATGERKVDITLEDETYQFMSHHVIDGRNVIPAGGYLVLVWDTFSMMKGTVYNELSVVFENIRFERATTIPKNDSVKLTVTIHKGSGQFEIVEENTVVVTGIIRIASNPDQEKTDPQFLNKNDTEEPLTTTDIYKELRLRGYEYTGLFRSLTSASIDGTKAHIAWMKNWTVFIESMLQLKMFGYNTRGLFVSTGILKMVIDTKTHNEIVRNMSDDNHDFVAFVYPDYDIIIAGGVEIYRLEVNSISKRKIMSTSVHEEFKFVANRDRAEISSEEMIILSTQLVLENGMNLTPKIVELIMDDDDISIEQLLSPTFANVIGAIPIMQPVVTLATESERYNSGSFTNVTHIEQIAITENGTFCVGVAYDVLSKKRHRCFQQLLRAIKEGGFLILRETTVDDDTFSYLEKCRLSVVLEKTWKTMTILLLKKREKPTNRMEIVYVKNDEISWIQKVHTVLNGMGEKDTKQSVTLLLIAEGDLENGILGFLRHLKLQPNGRIVKAVVIQDSTAPKFSLDHPLYAKQLANDIDVNVLRPGCVWGTYRYWPLPYKQQSYFHGIVTQMVQGDLLSLRWVEGSIQPDIDKANITYVAYSSLNLKDVMSAAGKLTPENVPRNNGNKDSPIRFEYSGINAQGRPVMGLTASGGLSNICIPVKNLEFPVPDGWSLEDAVTVPCAYITTYYALFYHGNLQKGDKVLVHGGTDSFSQAAINLALHEDCEVFTTVGSLEQRKFIKKTFPSIDDNHIGSSIDTSFEQLVMNQTSGKGVDIVLNSLADDKLLASMRCLGFSGRFLDLGKFDLNNGWWPVVQEKLYNDINKALCNKAIKPLGRTVFKKDEVQAAFRYMATQHCIGKVVIKIRDDIMSLDEPILAYPHFHADPSKTYVIIGGLGGFSLEIVDWLVNRGARSLVFVSRNETLNGYQRMKTDIWKTHGVKSRIISGVDASTTAGCNFILKSAEEQAPVDGIFNLAALLNDGFYVDQTLENCEGDLKSEIGVMKKMDEISREVCSELRYFAVLYATCSGIGNQSQTKFRIASAAIERICERRRLEGLPGLSIEWKTVGEYDAVVKAIEKNKRLILGAILPQRMSSCIEELDIFLMQDRPAVASTAIVEEEASGSDKTTILEAVLNIMSFKNFKGVSHNTSLSQLGMDSMMAEEIKQTLERDFEVFFSPHDIRNLSITKLVEISTTDSKKCTSQFKKSIRTSESTCRQDRLR